MKKGKEMWIEWELCELSSQAFSTSKIIQNFKGSKNKVS